MPTKADGATDYTSSISRHTADEGARLLRQIPRQDPPLALAIITELQIPVLRRTKQATKPTPGHIQGVVYKLGRTEVNCTQNVIRVDLDPADRTVWVRGTMGEADTTLANADISQLFSSQFSGGAPINGARHWGGAGTAQTRAAQRHKATRCDQRVKQLNDDLSDAFSAVFMSHFPAVTIQDDMKLHGRHGTAQGKRKLTVTRDSTL